MDEKERGRKTEVDRVKIERKRKEGEKESERSKERARKKDRGTEIIRARKRK